MTESTCGYLIRNNCWLMLYRNRKKNDVNAGKWIGVGGKRENGETWESCMCREIYEETGFTAVNPELRGTLMFHYENHEEEKIRIYTVTDFSGEMKECNEGTLQWIESGKVLDLALWEGDRVFLEKLLQEEKEQFYIDLYYDCEGNLLEVHENEG